jgi:hypothetical protein
MNISRSGEDVRKKLLNDEKKAEGKEDKKKTIRKVVSKE